MATFTRPTFTQILQGIQADINTRLPDADATLRYSLLNVLSYVIAGVCYALYGFINWVSEQVFPDTAVSENLRRWASIWGVSPIAATTASGNIDIDGVNGTVIAEGTEFQRSDGLLYTSTAEVTVASGTASVPLQSNDTGLDANCSVATVLTLVSPISGLENTGVVDASGITGGADDEEDPALRTRLLNRIQNPPQGGAENDYIQWALANAGVTRAWVYPNELGAGQVTVRFMMDDSYVNGIPLAGDVTDVQDYIDELRPITAEVNVAAPVADALNFNIHLNIEDSADIRDAVEANLQEMILRDSEPAGTIYLSRINEAISLATGEYDHTLVSPVANVTHATGHIATMGTITWS